MRTEQVCFDPLFHNLTVHNPVDVSASHGRFLPRRWDPLKRTYMLEPKGVVDSHHVALRDQELGGDMDVEGGEVGGDLLFECLFLARLGVALRRAHAQNHCRASTHHITAVRHGADNVERRHPIE
jgi:hypothetical protein